MHTFPKSFCWINWLNLKQWQNAIKLLCQCFQFAELIQMVRKKKKMQRRKVLTWLWWMNVFKWLYKYNRAYLFKCIIFYNLCYVVLHYRLLQIFFILLRINWSTQAAFQQDSFNLNNPFKVSIRNSRKRCEICSGLTIKTPERRQWTVPHPDVFRYRLNGVGSQKVNTKTFFQHFFHATFTQKLNEMSTNS